jgi:hypothetical protein
VWVDGSGETHRYFVAWEAVTDRQIHSRFHPTYDTVKKVVDVVIHDPVKKIIGVINYKSVATLDVETGRFTNANAEEVG